MVVKIIEVIVIFLNLCLGFFVLTQNRKSWNNRLFSLLCIVAAVWTSANFMNELSTALVWLQASYALGALVISTGLIWTLQLTESELKIYKYITVIFFAIMFCLGSFLPNFIIKSYFEVIAGARPEGNLGWGLPFYTLFYLAFALLIIFKLYSAKNNALDLEKRNQYRNILFGALITLIVTGINSFILPFFSIFPFGAIDNSGFLIFLIFIAYSITRHHLFNIKVIAIELALLGLWIFIIIRATLSSSIQDLPTEFLLLFIAIMFGGMLARFVLHDQKQREMLRSAHNELRDTYKQIKALTEHIDRTIPPESPAGQKRAL